MDLSQLTSPILQLVAAILVAAIPMCVAALFKRLGLSKQTALQESLDRFATMGAGLVYHELLARNASLADVRLKNQAIQNALTSLAPLVIPTLEQAGLTQEHLRTLVLGKLGQLLGVDPTTSLPAPTPLPAADSTAAVADAALSANGKAPVPVAVVGDNLTGTGGSDKSIAMKGVAAVLGVALLTVTIAACAQKPVTHVAEVENGLTMAELLAKRYTDLPRCGVNVPQLCSTQAAVDRIKQADQAAYEAVKAAEKSGADNDVTAAESAILVLISRIPVGGKS